MSFDLRKDLKVYQSVKYNRAKRFLDAGVRDGDNVKYDASIRLVTQKTQYGEDTTFVFQVGGHQPEAFKEFLTNIGANYLYSGSSFYDFARANPDKTYDDFVKGFSGSVAVRKADIDRFLERNLPANRMQALVFAENSRLAEMLGKRNVGRTRKRSAERRYRMIFYAWVLYGIEIPASAKRAEIDAAIAQLQPSDFGIPDCDVMDKVLTKLAETSMSQINEQVAVVKLVDEAVAKFNGKPIQRKKPRAAWLRNVWSIVSGYGAIDTGSLETVDLAADSDDD